MAIQRNYILFGAFLVLLSLVSCNKNESEVPQQPSLHRVISEQGSDTKTVGQHWLSTEIGHDGKRCPGCIMYHGKRIHRDCMHHGNYCRFVTKVNLAIDSSSVTATTTDTFGLTSEDFFVMPDRSLNYTDENNNRIFLNIPAQMVYRDSVTQQFTFTGLFFSDTAAYSNL